MLVRNREVIAFKPITDKVGIFEKKQIGTILPSILREYIHNAAFPERWGTYLDKWMPRV